MRTIQSFGIVSARSNVRLRSVDRTSVSHSGCDTSQQSPNSLDARRGEPMTTRTGCAFCISVVLSMIILATLSLAQTQTYGTVSGTIQDPSGGVVPGAKVTATNKATGQTETSVTNGDGRYVLSNLPTGTYDVAAEKEGFARCVNAGVILNPASSVQLNCQVKVGATTETVTVAAQALSVQTEDPKVSRVITDTQMQEMPVN